MKSVYRLAVVFFSLFVLVACVEAQGVDPVWSPPEEANTASIEHVKISVYAMAYAEGHKTVYLTNRNNKTKGIALSTANILGPYQAALDANSNIILRTKKKTDEGDTIYPPIAQIKFPVDIKEPLMVLVPSAEDQPYKAFIIDRSLGSFPAGSYLLMNMSSMGIRGHVGGTKVEVVAESVTSIIPSLGEDELLDVHFEYERPNQWRTFARTRWVYEKNKRTLLMAYLDPKTKRMRIRGVPLR